MDSLKEITDFFEESDAESIQDIVNEYFSDDNRSILPSIGSDTEDDSTNSESELDVTDLDETILLFDHKDTFVGDNSFSENTAKEWTTISQFFNAGCGCANECTTVFDKIDIFTLRSESSALNYWENYSNPQDLAVMAQIATFVATGRQTAKSNEIQKCRELTRAHFQLKGFRVCARMYLFAMALSNKKFKRLKGLYLDSGIISPLHGLHKKTPQNTSSAEQIRNVVNFLRRYAELHAIYLPGHYPNQKNFSVKLLPSCDNKAVLYRKYVESCDGVGLFPVGNSTFKNTWQTLCGDITTMKPKNDLCETCQQNYTSHSKITSLFQTDEAKLELITKMRTHLEIVAKEREFYNDSI
ncbi:hypothetical protein V9T40_000512 [Parthenolecanium corni]|uniref:Uncharacterized protein n=1 Tax=Parthenolecanium corni TaxID=536013 RepID=A0AAN9Y1T3_9HEMI